MDGVSLDALVMYGFEDVVGSEKEEQGLSGCQKFDLHRTRSGFSRVGGGFRRVVLSRLAVKLERLSARCIS
jgi:hypothetical protein